MLANIVRMIRKTMSIIYASNFTTSNDGWTLTGVSYIEPTGGQNGTGQIGFDYVGGYASAARSFILSSPSILEFYFSTGTGNPLQVLVNGVSVDLLAEGQSITKSTTYNLPAGTTEVKFVTEADFDELSETTVSNITISA